jgi:hypothetical protein
METLMNRLARVAAALSCALSYHTLALAQATRPAGPGNPASLGNASVAVPLQDLLGLMDRARGEAPVPVDYVFAPATYSGTTTNESATFATTLTVTLPRTGYTLVPLGPADAGVESAMVDGQPAPLVVRDGQLLAMLNGGGQKSLALRLRRPLLAGGGASRVVVPFPPSSAVNEVDLTLPGRDLAVDTPDGVIASTQPGENNTTRVVATFRGMSSGVISWRPRAELAGEARINADSQTRVVLRRGTLRYHTTLKLAIERGSAASVAVKIDPQAVLVSAGGKDYARVQEQAAADSRTLTITFAQPAQGERTLELVYEKDLPDAGGTVPLVPPAVVGARSDGGVVAVESDGAYDLRPVPGTLERLSVSELPAAMRSPATQLAYRYNAAGAAASLAVAPVRAQPAKVFATTHTRVAIERGVLRCAARVNYEILNAGVESFRIALPDAAEVTGVEGAGVRDTQVINENNGRFLVVGLKDLAKKEYGLVVTYDVRFREQTAAPTTRPTSRPATGPASAPSATAAMKTPLIAHPDAAENRGFVAVEVRGGYELSATANEADRIDVRELPQDLWALARSPLQLGYRYQGAGPQIELGITRHQDLDVLVAMADVCEATTTVTPDGRAITKLMFVTRNNLKPFMSLRLPEGAEVWSTFVDDRPVTPVRTADGRVLVPLKKSDDVDEFDDESYRARRERRRSGDTELRDVVKKQMQLADEPSSADLKPYDVEVVFVSPTVKLGDRGQLDLALPQSDVPVGHLAWAVFLPKGLRVVDSTGNLSEAARFTLPFRHFADAEVMRLEKLEKAQALQQAQQKLAQAEAQQASAAAKAAGVLPVRVEIPVVGAIHRFERLLTVEETPRLSLTYTRRLE